jgi:hypothetical protein
VLVAAVLDAPAVDAPLFDALVADDPVFETLALEPLEPVAPVVAVLAAAGALADAAAVDAPESASSPEHAASAQEVNRRIARDTGPPVSLQCNVDNAFCKFDHEARLSSLYASSSNLS